MRTRTVPRLLVSGAVVAMMFLSACQGEDSTSLPQSSSSPDDVSVQDRIPDAPPEAPETTPGEEGARAFTAHLVDVVFYVLATNDTEPLEQIADMDRCRTCVGLVEQSRDATTVQVPDGEVEITDVETVSAEDGFFTFKQTIEIPAGYALDAGTKEVGDEVGGGSESWTVNVRWVDDAWQLVAYE